MVVDIFVCTFLSRSFIQFRTSDEFGNKAYKVKYILEYKGAKKAVNKFNVETQNNIFIFMVWGFSFWNGTLNFNTSNWNLIATLCVGRSVN